MSAFIDFTGQQFGRWTVLSQAESSAVDRKRRWNCLCDCGNERVVYGRHLRSGRSTSCGCLRGELLGERNLIDLTGQRFGRLTALSLSQTGSWSIGKSAPWNCVCDCGNKCVIRVAQLRSGNTQSCGCLHRERTTKALTVDITGQRFGRWTVLSQAESKDWKAYWNCLCDCGSNCVVEGRTLRAQKSKSCGCLNETHGDSLKREYTIWNGMKQRVNNPNALAYFHYGGRGIKICQRWQDSYKNFLADMGRAPVGHSLDRIDVNGNYEPSNCRWATAQEQANNRRPPRARSSGRQ